MEKFMAGEVESFMNNSRASSEVKILSNSRDN